MEIRSAAAKRSWAIRNGTILGPPPLGIARVGSAPTPGFVDASTVAFPDGFWWEDFFLRDIAGFLRESRGVVAEEFRDELQMNNSRSNLAVRAGL